MNSELPISSRLQESGVAPKPAAGCSKVAIIMLFFVVLPGIAIAAWFGFVRGGFDPVRPFGRVLYVPDDDGGRVYMLSGQWRTTYTTGRYTSSRTYRTDLLVDLWAFRARDLTPVYRRRLETLRNGAMYDREILGEDRGTLWLVMNSRLEAVDARTGDRKAGAEQIEALNAPLRGLLPLESRYYTLDSLGLQVVAADGHIWRLAGDTLLATPEVSESTPTGTANVPAYQVPQSTYAFQQRGLDIPGFWLGLLTENEAAQFDANNAIGGMDRESRRKLWKATSTTAENFFGEYLDHSLFEPLARSPEFLDAGLLAEYHNGQATGIIWLSEPDSVVVLHADRLDEAGRLQLTRVSGPDGDVVWETALPLSILQSLMRTPEGVVLLGYEIPPAPDDQPRDPSHDSPHRLISVNLADGTLHVFHAETYDRHPVAVAAEPAP